MRKLLIVTVLLFLLIGGFYVSLPVIAEYSVRQILTDHQINASFDLKHPGLNRIEISQLKLEKETTTESFTLTADSISFNFNPWQLFNEQRIKTLNIEALKLDLALDLSAESASPAPDNDTSQLPFPPLPAYLFAQIPADSITLPDIIINLVTSDKTTIRNFAFSGNLIANKEQLDLRLAAINKHINNQEKNNQELNKTLLPPEAQLRLIINNQNSGKLAVTIDQATVVQNDFLLSVKDNQLNTQNQSTVHLEQLQPLLQHPWLAEFVQLPDSDTLPDITGTVAIQGNSQIPLNGDLSAASHQYQITSKAEVWHLIPDINQLSLQQDSRLTLDKNELILDIQQLSAIGKELTTGGHQSVSSNSVQINLQHPIRLSSSLEMLSQSGFNSISLPEIKLLLSFQPVTIKAQAQPDTWVNMPPVSLTLSEVNLTENSLKAELIANNIEVRSGLISGKRPLPLINLNNNATITSDKITNRFRIRLQDSLLSNDVTIIGSSKTDAKTNRTTASWKTSLPLFGIEKLALRYVPQLPPELVFNSGTLQHQGWLDQNSSGVALRFLNRLKNTSFSYDQTHLYDIYGDSETVKSHKGKLSDTGQLNIAFIDAGVPLENFTSSYRFEQSPAGKQQLKLNSSTVDMLGGRITTLPISMDPRTPDFDTAVAVTGIDLQQLIALEQQEGLTGSGTLNGVLPISVKQGQITIVDGQINSTPEGGWIKFDPPPAFIAMAKTTPGLEIAFDAMRNMRYQSLGIKLNYLPEGTAFLQTHLKGHNPDWNSNQPVDLTINIEENIPKLLQALQFTDKLTETLEKRYR